ncbi:MAG: hypothetical protein OXH11_08135, partial [Candidatus Aminicenantes bacterium]|nr:hypothetical protein [Candidatus Aminicenantes bacterium]
DSFRRVNKKIHLPQKPAVLGCWLNPLRRLASQLSNLGAKIRKGTNKVFLILYLYPSDKFSRPADAPTI